MAVLTGCHGNSGKESAGFMDFPVTEEAQWEYISSDEIIPHASGLIIGDSTLNVLGRIDNKLYHIYSKTDGRLLNSMMDRGEGPQESISPSEAVPDDDGGLWIYDLPTTKFKHYDKDMNIIEEHFVKDNFPIAWKTWPLNGNRYLVLGPVGYGNDMRRTYRILNADSDSVISIYDSLKGPFTENPQMASKTQFMASMSPDKKRLATLSSYGAAAEFFKIEGDSLIQTVAEIIIPQEFIEINGIKSLPHNEPEKMLIGFTAVCATNKYVYGAFYGSTEDNKTASICIWDWEGNPVRMIKTDSTIANMAMDTTTNTIYAIVRTPEEHERQFAKLKL